MANCLAEGVVDILDDTMESVERVEKQLGIC